MDISAIHVLNHFTHRSIVAAGLERWVGQINRSSDIVQHGVNRVHYCLNRNISRAADNERVAAIFPELLSDGVQFLGMDWIGGIRYSSCPSLFRNTPEQRHGHRTYLPMGPRDANICT